MPAPPTNPTGADARRIASALTGVAALTARRYPTGLCHHVFDMELADGQRVVARLASPDSLAALRGGIHWHGRLRTGGVPVPELLHAEPDPAVHGFGVMMLERLPGVDLGDVIHTLTPPQRRNVARSVGDLQRAVQRLPRGECFGYCADPNDGPWGHETWTDAVNASVDRARRWVQEGQRFPLERVDRAAEHISRARGYLDGIEPTPFLDDTTTKNVLVHDGRCTGVVDTDEVCFGDPMSALGLTYTALSAHGHDTDYVHDWLDAADADERSRRAVPLYALVSCVTFMGEVGRGFNGNPTDAPGFARRLDPLFGELIETLDASPL